MAGEPPSGPCSRTSHRMRTRSMTSADPTTTPSHSATSSLGPHRLRGATPWLAAAAAGGCKPSRTGADARLLDDQTNPLQVYELFAASSTPPPPPPPAELTMEWLVDETLWPQEQLEEVLSALDPSEGKGQVILGQGLLAPVRRGSAKASWRGTSPRTSPSGRASSISTRATATRSSWRASDRSSSRRGVSVQASGRRRARDDRR